MGAAWAIELATGEQPDDFAAVVLFYGAAEGDFARSRAAFLGHFAPGDEWEPDEGVAALEAAIRAAGKEVTFHRYPGAGHWFFEADRPDAYDPPPRISPGNAPSRTCASTSAAMVMRARLPARETIRIKAPQEVLYRAFTDPVALAAWLAPGDPATDVAEVPTPRPSPRVQGHRRRRRYTARFVELTPPRRIVDG